MSRTTYFALGEYQICATNRIRVELRYLRVLIKLHQYPDSTLVRSVAKRGSESLATSSKYSCKYGSSEATLRSPDQWIISRPRRLNCGKSKLMIQATITLMLIGLWGAPGLTPHLLPASAWRQLSDEPKTTGETQKPEITEATWLNHPKIQAIRRIVKTTQSGLKRNIFKTSERKFESCQDQFFTLRRIARDSKGVAAWYEDYSEGQDASWDFHYYYDRNGRLRFVFASARSANGTREQLRIYFDETGKRLWQTDKLLNGPGCPGCFSAYTDSDEALAFDPAKAFANDEGCKEMEPKSGRRARRT